ncbi:MAG: RNA polymerase sigma factor [Bacteroidales bacterium]|nr:RNA polymerase sigma factor [Bacteroidales bacterium]
MKINWNNNDEVKVIIEKCKKGDLMSQELIYKSFYGKMLPVCMRYSKNKEESYDILQEGFVKVFNNLSSFNFKGSFEGWIRRIMVNTAIDMFRKSKSSTLLTEPISDNSIEEIYLNDEEEKMIEELKGEIILNLIQQLPPAYRMVLNLYVFENLTHAEIAQLLGIKEGTSKSNYFKAKEKLKKLIIEYKKQHEYEII